MPVAAVVPLEDAVDAAGPPEEERHGILVPIRGDLEASVMMLLPDEDAATLCAPFGVDPASEDGRSALGEFGNILGTSYVNALGALAGMEMEPDPPHVTHDLLGAIITSALLERGNTEVALVLDSKLRVEGEDCALSFLLLPEPGGVDDMLRRLGVQ